MAGTLVVASAFIILGLGVALRPFIEIGPDEHYEVMKAALWAGGYGPYGEVWNDQPPLHTILLGWLFKAFGPDIGVARTLAVLFGLLLVTGLFAIVKKCAGTPAACFAVCALLAAPQVLQLSLSVMLEVPAMAVGAWSLYPICCATNAPRPVTKRGWMTSAVLLAIALQIKLTAVIFAPAVCAGILLAAKRTEVGGLRRGVVQVLSWSGVLLAGFVLLGWLLGNDYGVAWHSHFAAPVVAAREIKAHALSWHELLEHWEGWMVAGLGLALALISRNGGAVACPGVLLATVSLIHVFHRPWWPYYYLHFAIPLAWLGGQALSETFRGMLALAGRAKSPVTRLLVIMPCAGLVGLLVTQGGMRLVEEVKRIRALPRVEGSVLIEKMRQYAPGTSWAYARSHIQVFHAGLLVPPELAVLVKKRFWSGQMDEGRLLALLRRYEPEQVLLSNGEFNTESEQWIRQDYVSVCRDMEVELFVAKKLGPVARGPNP